MFNKGIKMTIKTERLILKALDENHAEMLLDFVKTNKDIFEKYESKKDPLFYTKAYQKNILKTEYSSMKQGTFARFYAFTYDNPDKIIGTVSFGFHRPLPYASFNIGYKFDPNVWGLGYAKEAAIACIDEIFRSTDTHQIFAYIMPENIRSIKLIESVGFSWEGLSTKCLFVNGSWEDHHVYKLLKN